MDIRLPDLNGFEITKIIKQKKPNIPIIAQTAYAAETDRQKCLNAGCDDYISKPTDRIKLIDIIRKYLVEK
jgi:CheY-like chemotaxis protein